MVTWGYKPVKILQISLAAWGDSVSTSLILSWEANYISEWNPGILNIVYGPMPHHCFNMSQIAGSHEHLGIYFQTTQKKKKVLPSTWGNFSSRNSKSSSPLPILCVSRPWKCLWCSLASGWSHPNSEQMASYMLWFYRERLFQLSETSATHYLGHKPYNAI